MGTKFTTIEREKSFKKTVFNGVLLLGNVKPSKVLPGVYDNIMWIGHDEHYGDVFKAWNYGQNSFTLYFGEKGDEFDN
jgi:hypothetical protein